MTGDVTDRFNGITLFRIALFWQKAIEYFTKLTIDFLTDKGECLFYMGFYRLLVLLISFRPGWNVDCWVAGRCTTRLIGGRGLLMVDQLTSQSMCCCKFSKTVVSKTPQVRLSRHNLLLKNSCVGHLVAQPYGHPSVDMAT